jgi:type IV conjugative transfer system coupling protein TraD
MEKMSLIETITEGGQTWAHRIRMLRQVIKLAMMFSFIIGLIVFVCLLLDKPLFLYQSTWYYLKANTLGIISGEITVNADFWEDIAKERYFSEYPLLPSHKVEAFTQPYAKYLYEHILRDISRTSPIACISFIALLCFFFIRGLRGKRKQHISGRKISSAFYVALKLKLTGKASRFQIGSIPLVKGTETQHILVSGGTGSGKTNCFNHLLPQIRNAGQRALIVDTTGGFVERYYRPGKDILLNPFDPKGVSWHPWVECLDLFDYDALAESFIPQSYTQSENYWRIASRSLFSALLQKLSNTQETSELNRWILFESLAKLCSFVQGTKAGAYLDMSSERTAGSIRTVATTFLQCLEHVQNTTTPFSIRRWVQEENSDSWLFLSCKPSQRAVLNPLLACWFSVAARSLLQMKPDLNRRLWFVIDELPSLNRLNELESFLAESRKYGGCGLFAFQSPAQIENIYGQSTAKTIIGNCMTKIIFAEQDPQIAEMLSRSIGEREIKEYQEGLSYGAHETRDGVSLSLQVKKQPLVSASDIQSLDKNQAYIKLPGNVSISKLKLNII